MIILFLFQRLPSGSRIGLDASLTTVADAHGLKERLATVNSVLVPVERNLVDIAWGNQRPASPHDKVFVHSVEFAGNKYMIMQHS